MTRILCPIPESTWKRMRLDEARPRLEALGQVTYCLDPRALSDEAYAALWEDAEAVVTGWGVRPPSQELLDRAKALRIISHTAGSVRMFPRYALEKGVVVTSARAAIARTVAEHCLLSALMLLRRRGVAGADPRAAETLFDKGVGLVGFGEVGRRFRQLLAPFGCRVSVFDPFLGEQDAAFHGVDPTDLETLLRTSHVVSLHAPDIPETRGMIGARELGLLRDDAVLINSARGRLVDTAALTEALAGGRFWAAIDVTDPEPLPEGHPLRSMPNVLFTAHLAGPTEDELPRLVNMAITDLERFLRGEEPLHAIGLAEYDIMSF